MFTVYPSNQLIRQDQAPKDKRHTKLIAACKSNDLNVLRELLQEGPFKEKINLNYAGDGQIPLCLTAQKGHMEATSLLLDSGADIDSQDNLGKSPLMRAVISAKKEMVVLLLERGANVDSLDTTCSNSFHYAAIKTDSDILTILLARCKDPSIIHQSDSKNKTPLYRAIEQGNHKSVELLLNCTLNLAINHLQYITALDFALDCKYASEEIREKIKLILKDFIQVIVNRLVILFARSVLDLDALSLILKKTLFTYTKTPAGQKTVMETISKAIESKNIFDTFKGKGVNLAFLPHYASTQARTMKSIPMCPTHQETDGLKGTFVKFLQRISRQPLGFRR